MASHAKFHSHIDELYWNIEAILRDLSSSDHAQGILVTVMQLRGGVVSDVNHKGMTVFV